MAAPSSLAELLANVDPDLPDNVTYVLGAIRTWAEGVDGSLRQASLTQAENRDDFRNIEGASRGINLRLSSAEGALTKLEKMVKEMKPTDPDVAIPPEPAVPDVAKPPAPAEDGHEDFPQEHWRLGARWANR